MIDAVAVESAIDCESQKAQAGELPAEVLHPHAADSNILLSPNKQIDSAGTARTLQPVVFGI